MRSYTTNRVYLGGAGGGGGGRKCVEIIKANRYILGSNI